MTESSCVWLDYFSHDLEKTISFYSDVFPWAADRQIDRTLGEYPKFLIEGMPFAGSFLTPESARTEGTPPFWVGYMTCELAQVREMFPQVGCTPLSPVVHSAAGDTLLFADAGGALLSAFEPSLEFSAYSGNDGVLWMRLYAREPLASAHLYSDLFGWRFESHENSILFLGRQQDIVTQATWIAADTWVYFFKTPSLSAAKATITRAGGNIVLDTSVNQLRAAVCADPNGGVFGILEA